MHVYSEVSLTWDFLPCKRIGLHWEWLADGSSVFTAEEKKEEKKEESEESDDDMGFGLFD